MYIEDKLYKEIIKKTIIQTLDIVFLNESGQILLCLRKNKPLKGIYYIPGGRRYKNELVLESAKRKAKEELGINIDITKLLFLGVYDDIFNNSIYNNIGTHCSTITYVYKLNKIEENKLTLDNQHSSYMFFNIDDDLIHEKVKIRINDIKKLNKI